MVGFVVAMSLVVVLIAVQLVRVQVADRGPVVAYGATQRKGFRTLPASRGAIYDRNGQALAMTVAQPIVVADPANVRHKITTARAMAEALDLDPAEVEASLRTNKRYEVISKDATAAQVAKLRKLIAKGTVEGTSIEDQYVRSYPSDDLAEGVVGHALAEGEKDKAGHTGGIAGIEQAYDKVLRGKPGKLFYEQDVWRTPIAGGTKKVEPAHRGPTSTSPSTRPCSTRPSRR
ncbi:MAG: hypothetical protein U0P45_07200 [Acidimicrobiales bacterium]